jgi:large subunit ribosomal protein L16
VAGKKNKNIALFPLKLKFRCFHKFLASGSEVNRRLYISKTSEQYVLKAQEFGRLSTAELEASRRYLRRFAKKGRTGRIYMRVYPSLPITKKPSETRMGKGKSSKVFDYVCPIRAGKIIFELSGFTKKNAFGLLMKIQERLSLTTKIVRLIR